MKRYQKMRALLLESLLGVLWSSNSYVLNSGHRISFRMTEKELLRTPRRRVSKVYPVEAVSSCTGTIRLLASKENAAESAVPVTPSPVKKRRRKSPSKSTSNSITNRQLVTDTTGTGTLTYDEIEAINPSQPFLDLHVSPEELRPSATLTTGQCFHWTAVATHDSSLDGKQQLVQQSAWGTHNATMWIGTLRIGHGDGQEPVAHSSVVVALQETPTSTLYRPLTPVPGNVNLGDFLKQYFQLEHSLANLYQEWSSADERLRVIAKYIPGVRIIDQDPWECLVSFICSSNNNIPRITKMLLAIRREFGQPLLTIGQTGKTFYSFPSLHELSQVATDDILRQSCGLGYRSKYILETCKLLNDFGGEAYLQELKQQNDPMAVQEKLCDFCGVGRKVADCVALFSLRQSDAIPVDTHVWNIARRDYDPSRSLEHVKSLTPTIYKQVGDLFRSKFATKAGWAHSLLFVAELPSFRPVLPEELVSEMDQFREEEQARKKEAKAAKRRSKSKDFAEDDAPGERGTPDVGGKN